MSSKRILILGCSGAGKSTLARSLHKELDLPIIHLDQHYWKPNWIESTKAEWTAKVAELIKDDEWIMDGNYGGTLDMRIERADTIIFKDASTFTCLYRVIRRIFKYRGQVRPDMTEGCIERFDLEFFHYVLVYNLVRRKTILKKISAFDQDKQVIITRSQLDVVDKLRHKKSAERFPLGTN